MEETIKIIATVIGSIIGIITLMKGIYEYILQGRQKRAEYYQKMKDKFRTEEKLKNIHEMIEKHKKGEELKIDIVAKFYYVGFFEEVALATNSNLIKFNVAYHMFGHYAIDLKKNKEFWNNESLKDEQYWVIFTKFINDIETYKKCKIKFYVKHYFKRLKY